MSNGVALCKLHHAAFDRFFFAIRPDYVIEVRPSVLRESDVPMHVVGLQEIDGQQIHLPRRSVDLPDRARPSAATSSSGRRRGRARLHAAVGRDEPPMLAGRDDGAQDQVS